MSKEQQPLLNKLALPSATEYIQPMMQGVASFSNVVGSFFAIYAGADKVNDKINPFFYTAMSTSLLFAFANAYECRRIYNRRQTTWAEIEESRNQLTSVEIARC